MPMLSRLLAIAAIACTITLVSHGQNRAEACFFNLPPPAALVADEGDFVFYGEKLSEQVWREGKYRVVEATFRAIGHWKGPPEDVIRVRELILLFGPCSGPMDMSFPERTMVIGKYEEGAAYSLRIMGEHSAYRWGIQARYPPLREWSVIPPAWEAIVQDDSWLDIHIKATGRDSLEAWYDSPVARSDWPEVSELLGADGLDLLDKRRGP